LDVQGQLMNNFDRRAARDLAARPRRPERTDGSIAGWTPERRK
jgi:hypothetical protein